MRLVSRCPGMQRRAGPSPRSGDGGGPIMDRRHFVAAAAIGAGTLAAPALSQGIRELRMITTWPRTLPGLQASAERAAETINALSAGRLRISVFSAGEI